ncbi:MAG: lipid-A-disaccharide synthase [Gammaproteobacteria bacterium]
MQKRVLIISGEASGDHHAAELVKAVHQLDPTVHFLAMGGEKLRAAGAEIIVDSKPLAVVGAIEILRHIVPIFKAWRTVRRTIRQTPLDLVVLIDYPEFNLQMAKAAKKAGVKVLYYITPQVWAWKQKRLKTIRERVDKVLVIFPFEQPFYQRAQIPVEYVGHPLAGKVQPTQLSTAMREQLKIAPTDRAIGLLPGSRQGELRRLLPVILQAAELLLAQHPNLVFILPLASSLEVSDIQPYLVNASLPLKIISDSKDHYNALQLCEAAIVTSGTATLEVALLGIPMVIIYKVAASTYHIVKRIIKIPYIGLCNIVAEKKVVQELIQHDANSTQIAAEIQHILTDTAYQTSMRAELNTLKNKLGDGEGAQRAARALLKLVS